MNTAEPVLSIQNALGEGPLWSVDEQALYWVDIHDNCFYRLTPNNGEYQRFEVGLPVGCLAVTDIGRLLLGTQRGLALWNPDSEQLTFLMNEAYEPEGRFNDGAADRQGRFWAGTMSNKPENNLYRLDPDGQVHVMQTGVTISNGIGWSPDNTIMYYSDSGPGIIYAYDFDAGTGTISNRRTFVLPSDTDDVPDGLTVDSEGFIWCAHWGSWKVKRYDPDGNIEREIELPVKLPTSCMFGGPDLNELYITTARSPLSEAEKEQQPHAGDLFRIETDVRGLPEPVVHLDASLLG